MKYNLDVVDWLIRSNLLNLQMLDEHLARTLDDPRVHSFFLPSIFVMQLVQVCVCFKCMCIYVCVYECVGGMLQAIGVLGGEHEHVDMHKHKNILYK